MSDILAQISTAVIEGKLEGMEQLTQQALDGGLDAQQITCLSRRCSAPPGRCNPR
jgi:hypothetical protein